MKKLILALTLMSSFASSANSISINCVAFSADGQRIDIKRLNTEGQYGEMSLLVNNKKAGMIASSECGEDIECNLAKGFNLAFIDPENKIGTRLLINLEETIDEISSTSGRRTFSQRVVQISPILKTPFNKRQFHGVCHTNL